MDAKEREKSIEISACNRIPSLERREGWRKDWKDKQMERRQKREAGKEEKATLSLTR